MARLRRFRSFAVAEKLARFYPKAVNGIVCLISVGLGRRRTGVARGIRGKSPSYWPSRIVAKRLDQQGKGRRGLATARIPEVVAGIGEAPILKYALETYSSQIRQRHPFRHISQSESGQRRIQHLHRGVEGELAFDANLSTTAGLYGDAFVVSNGSGERAADGGAAILTRRGRVRDRADVPTPDARAAGAVRARWAAAGRAAARDRRRLPRPIFSPPAALRRTAR